MKNGDRVSKKDRKDQYLHEVSKIMFLVTNENMGLCLYIYYNNFFGFGLSNSGTNIFFNPIFLHVLFIFYRDA